MIKILLLISYHKFRFFCRFNLSDRVIEKYINPDTALTKLNPPCERKIMLSVKKTNSVISMHAKQIQVLKIKDLHRLKELTSYMAFLPV